jgi:[protein-PII] uridylyltransferase
VALQPDERGRSYLLSVTATDRIGLLSSIARVLAAHQINVQTAKILTLGERVEDVFLVDGAALAEAKRQIEVETELLAAIAS